MAFRIGVDSGGTFTDVCLLDETTGRVWVWKLPSTPNDPSIAIVGGTREILSRFGGDDPSEVSFFGHGTTVATNALIQGRGARTGLVTNQGFRDLLELARQRRPHLYDLQADKPPALVPRDRRHEVAARIHFDGRVERGRGFLASRTSPRWPSVSCTAFSILTMKRWWRRSLKRS
jgi:N-methylhydantoinase A